MWTQRYNVSGHYRHHFDWRGGKTGIDGVADRASTFMVYLNADCSGGGTVFPRLRRPAGSQWCQFVYCERDEDEARVYLNLEIASDVKGLTFKPIKGNAIFWENLRPDGTGYPETWHAALPVRSGRKVGLNIWSWYQPPSWTRKHQ
jgi:prolyl 4-hydroxylase